MCVDCNVTPMHRLTAKRGLQYESSKVRRLPLLYIKLAEQNTWHGRLSHLNVPIALQRWRVGIARQLVWGRFGAHVHVANVGAALAIEAIGRTGME